jgi:hypothetical protein
MSFFLLEMEQMTEEEKQAALQDMYGNLFQAVQRNNKRLKRPGPTPIETLLEIMRREVDAIPADKKSALLEAVKRAPGRDFCDGRLKTFLIRESMDAKVRSKGELSLSHASICLIGLIFTIMYAESGRSFCQILGRAPKSVWGRQILPSVDPRRGASR